MATLTSTIVPAFLQRSWQYESETFFKQLEVLRDFHQEANKLLSKLEAVSREYDLAIEDLWEYWVETGELDEKFAEKTKAISRKSNTAIDETLPQIKSHYILTNAIFSLKAEEVDVPSEKLRTKHDKWLQEWKALQKRVDDIAATAKAAKSEDERQKQVKPMLDAISDSGRLLADLVSHISAWIEDTTDELLKKVKRR